jgi:hypothetical protein
MVLEIDALNLNHDKCNLLKNKKIIVYSYSRLHPKKTAHEEEY